MIFLILLSKSDSISPTTGPYRTHMHTQALKPINNVLPSIGCGSVAFIPGLAIDVSYLSFSLNWAQLFFLGGGLGPPPLDELNSFYSFFFSHFWASVCSSVFLECFFLLFIKLQLFILWILNATSHLNLSVLCFHNTRHPYHTV